MASNAHLPGQPVPRFAPRQLPPGAVFALRAGATRDRRNDGKRIRVTNRRGLFAGQVTDVLVIEIHVDEGAQFALFRVEVLLQVGVLRRQLRQRFADGAGFHRDRVLFTGERTQRGGNVYEVYPAARPPQSAKFSSTPLDTLHELQYTIRDELRMILA